MEIENDKAIVDLRRYNGLLEMEKNIDSVGCVSFYRCNQGIYGIASLPTRYYVTNDKALREASEINSAMSKDINKFGANIASLEAKLEESEKVVFSFHNMSLWQFFLYKYFTKIKKDESR